MIIDTKYGKIQGLDKEGYSCFLGVPYAKPPVGDLRWKAPVEPEHYSGVRKATAFGNRCMQEIIEDDLYTKEFYSNNEYNCTMSEDCLYLNIWTPLTAKDERDLPGSAENKNYPVAFWIHGGAFMGGYASEMEFDGEAYCKRGVVLVSVEYRCNVFGFWAHPWLTEENEKKISGNYGILDQIAALRWVHDNIAAFGGDADNITIFGQSAGAMSVQTLLSSELANGLYSKAIMQSGGSYKYGLHRDITLGEQEKIGRMLPEVLGAAGLEEMRSLDAKTIIRKMGAFIGKGIASFDGLFLIPTIDGYVLKDGYYKLMDEGKMPDVPCLIGSNADDILQDEDKSGIAKKQPLHKGSVAYSLKLEETGNQPAYVYFFNRKLPGDDHGAFHSAELWYMFGTLGRCWRPMDKHDYELSDEMMDAWTTFMKQGQFGDDEWKRCIKSEPYYRVFE